MNMKMMLLKAVLAAQLVAMPFLAGAAVSSQIVVTKAAYSETSSNKQQVVLWLEQHTARVKEVLNNTPQISDTTHLR